MKYFSWVASIGLCSSGLYFHRLYGMWKSKGEQHWWILIGRQNYALVCVWQFHYGTQASAITFLRAAGAGLYRRDAFVGFILDCHRDSYALCHLRSDLHRLNVYTAYEFLEKRFDLENPRAHSIFISYTTWISMRTYHFTRRQLFYHPFLDGIFTGRIYLWEDWLFCILWQATRAVVSHKMQQMAVILVGMVAAGFMVVHLLPENISFRESLNLCRKMGKLMWSIFLFDLKNQYNVWSGLIGGLFLMLSYFRNDQSQVGKIFSGKRWDKADSVLLFNGVIKIPMQFSILLIGALLCVFYLISAIPFAFQQCGSR